MPGYRDKLHLSKCYDLFIMFSNVFDTYVYEAVLNFTCVCVYVSVAKFSVSVHKDFCRGLRNYGLTSSVNTYRVSS